MTRRVLLIDDSDLIRDSFAMYLSLQGVGCVSAGTGDEGMRLFRTCGPSLVLLDVELPDCSGLDLLADMQQEPGCPPIVVWSGRPDAVSAAARSGAAAVVLKPFAADEVLQTINRLCAP